MPSQYTQITPSISVSPYNHYNEVTEEDKKEQVYIEGLTLTNYGHVIGEVVKEFIDIVIPSIT